MYSVSALDKNPDGSPKNVSVVALALDDIFNTPKTIRKFQKFLGRLINEKQLTSLTKRQMEVLELLAQGFLRKEIADQLNISKYTVDDHKKASLGSK